MSATSIIPTPDPTSVAWSLYIDSQSFNLTNVKGEAMTLSLDRLNNYFYASTVQAIFQAFILGFGAMLFIVLIALTHRERRRQPIYLLNLISLFLITFRAIVNLIIATASYRGVGQIFLGGRAQYGPGTWAPSVISGLLQPFLYSTILASLILQIHVVFGSEPLTRRTLTIVLTVAAVVLVVLVTTFAVYQTIIQFKSISMPRWLFKVIRIYFVVFVGITCLIFLYKLAMAIRRRKRMGQPANPLQIFFVFSCQSLVVPLVIYIVDLNDIPRPDLTLGHLAQIFLICSLPLSTLWASSESQSQLKMPVAPNASQDTTTDSRSWRSKWSWWMKRHEDPALQNSMHSSNFSEDLEKAPSYHDEKRQEEEQTKAT